MGTFQGSRVAAFAAGVVAFAPWVVAQDALWTSPAPGVFSDPANWSGGVVPDVNRAALFGGSPGAGPFDVTFASPANSRALTITNQRPVFRLGGHHYAIATSLLVNGPETPLVSPRLSLDGGTLAVAVLDVGAAAAQRGELTLTGAAVTVNQVHVGAGGGSGALTLDHASQLRAMSLGFFGHTSGECTLTLANASRLQLDSAGTVAFGRLAGIADVLVTGGSQIVLSSSGFARIGDGIGSVATIELSGPGSLLSAPGELAIGSAGGSASVGVHDGASISAARFRIGAEPRPTGSTSLTLSGPESRLVWTQDLRVGSPADFGAPARLEMYAGARLVGPLSGPTATFDVRSEFRGVGTIEHAARFLGSVTVSASPTQLAPGTLTLLGRYENGPGTSLRIPVAGTAPGSQYSQIVVADTASLQGSVELVPIDGFTFAPGQTFEIVRYLSGGGNILSITSPAPNRFRATFSQSRVVVTVYCPADWSLDGVVNSQDFFSFLTAFFQNSADFNRDGATNSQDFFDFLSALMGPC